MTLPSLPGGSGPLEPKGWDRIVINGEVLPGHSKVTKGGVEYRLDKKDSFNVKGSKPSNAGPSVQEVEFETTVWTDGQLTRLTQIVTEIRRIVDARYEVDPSARQQPAVFDFDAPAVRHLGVSKVMIKTISPLLDATEPKGAKKIQFVVAHWDRPRPSGGTPKAPPPTRTVRNVRREIGEAETPLPSSQGWIAGPTGTQPPTKERR
jgi:hypothetical protein